MIPNSERYDKMATLSLLFAILNIVIVVIVSIMSTLHTAFSLDFLYGLPYIYSAVFDIIVYLSYFISLALMILSLVFSFISTKNNTTKRKAAIAARIIVFTEIGISVLAFIAAIGFFILAMMYGPYY